MENGHLQNDLSAEFIVAHAEFIFASQNSRKSSRRPSSLSVTTQKTKCIKSESCKHEAKYKATAHTNPLEDYQTHMLLPLLLVRTKKVEDIEHLLIPMRSR